MTLHDRDSIREHLNDSLFASKDLSRSLPKYRFPEGEMAAEDAYQAVQDELMLDGNSRQNLATFCQTWEEPQVRALMDLSIDKNMIDKDEYPQTAELEADTGLDVDIHVDGASGAFLAPFCAPDLRWDFRLARVKSISTSGHKFGLAPLGVGWVIWRDVSELPDDLIFHVTYLGGDMPVFQINFSRPAGQIVAQYYNFLRLGRDGYRGVHEAAYSNCAVLAAEIPKLGPFEIICDGDAQKGIPAVAWKLADGANPGYSLYDLADRLRLQGWQVPAYPLTGSVSDVAVQRVLVRQDVSRDLARLLLAEFADAVKHFETHPVSVSMTKEESSGFSHL